jgi:hypothetical protein
MRYKSRKQNTYEAGNSLCKVNCQQLTVKFFSAKNFPVNIVILELKTIYVSIIARYS